MNLVEYTQQKHKPNFISFEAANPFSDTATKFIWVHQTYREKEWETKWRCSCTWFKGIRYPSTTIELSLHYRAQKSYSGTHTHSQQMQNDISIHLSLSQWFQDYHKRIFYPYGSMWCVFFCFSLQFPKWLGQKDYRIESFS